MHAQLPVTIGSSLLNAAIAQDAGLAIDLALPTALQKPGTTARNLLKAITIRSQQNLGWDLWFYATAAHYDGTTLNSDSWIGHWAFLSTDAAATVSNDPSPLIYKYFIFGNDMPLRDDDQPALGRVHLMVIPRGAAKLVNQGLVIELALQPQFGY